MSSLRQFMVCFGLALASFALMLVWLDSRQLPNSAVADDSALKLHFSEGDPSEMSASTSSSLDVSQQRANQVAPPESEPRGDLADLPAIASRIDIRIPATVSALPVVVDSSSDPGLAQRLDRNGDSVRAKQVQSVLETSPRDIEAVVEPLADRKTARPAPPLSPAVKATIASHIQYGQSLARRGAFQSAQSEFLHSLATVARQLDAVDGNDRHVRALGRAWTAIKESQDFLGVAVDGVGQHGVPEITAGHRTPILNSDRDLQCSHVDAYQRYLSYAADELRIACGDDPILADAYFSLGRLFTLMADHDAGHAIGSRAQALIMHELALDCDAQHFRSANELGVLLAWHGDLNRAKEALLRSVMIRPQVESWQNLAEVHRRSGEDDLAQRAYYEAQIAHQQATRGGSTSDRAWIEPSTFAAMSKPDATWEPVNSNRLPAAPANQRHSSANAKSFAWPEPRHFR